MQISIINTHEVTDLRQYWGDLKHHRKPTREGQGGPTPPTGPRQGMSAPSRQITRWGRALPKGDREDLKPDLEHTTPLPSSGLFYCFPTGRPYSQFIRHLCAMGLLKIKDRGKDRPSSYLNNQCILLLIFTCFTEPLKGIINNKRQENLLAGTEHTVSASSDTRSHAHRSTEAASIWVPLFSGQTRYLVTPAQPEDPKDVGSNQELYGYFHFWKRWQSQGYRRGRSSFPNFYTWS